MNMEQLIDATTAIQETGEGGQTKYVLSRDVSISLPDRLAPKAEAILPWVEIAKAEGGWRITVKKGYAWDGATSASDFAPGGCLGEALRLLASGDAAGAVAMVAPLLGSLPHDPAYQFLEEISKIWGVPESETRRWADGLLRAVMEAAGATGQARRYYWGVRLAGGVFHAVRGWFVRPRSRISLNPLRWFGAMMACALILAQGCSTAGRLGAAAGGAAAVVACHNYFVAEAEADERAQVEAGRLPLVKSNGQLIWENKLWYGLSLGLGALAGNGIAEYAADKAETTTVYSPNVENNYNYAEPSTEAEATDEGATNAAE